MTETQYLSDHTKTLIGDIYHGENITISTLYRTNEILTNVIDPDKIVQYTILLANFISNDKDANNTSPYYILTIFEEILTDFYAYLDSIKKSRLSYNERIFLKENLDVASLLILISAVDAQGNDFISDSSLVEILSFVKTMIRCKPNLGVNKIISMLCR